MAFWADKVADKIQKDLKERIRAGEPLVIRDEKTASGRIHVGSMRGVAVHGILSHILSQEKIPNTFLYEINDFDAFDTVPTYLDASYEAYLGKPLYALPAPEGAGNYAEYFGSQFARVIEVSGFHPTFYYSSEEYKAGKYNEVIALALTQADTIRRIYKEVSGGGREEQWLPLMVVCEKCGKVATTRSVSFDGDIVHYICDQEGSGASGCGHEGDISPFNGNAKLPWKVEWAAKFRVFAVDIEGEGKDLATKGGARDVANRISQDVFEYKPPYDVPYEFFLVGGRKMSTSKGAGSSAYEVGELLPKNIFRLALLSKDIKRAINVEPEGDTIPTLYDLYDKIAEKYWTGVDDDEARLFELVHANNVPKQHFLPRFSQIAFLVQMPHMDVEEEVAKLKGGALTDIEKEEVTTRADYAKRWLNMYAPESYIFKIQNALPESAKAFNEKQKEALARVLRYIDTHEKLDGQELHTKLHEIRSEVDIEPKDFFSAIYIAFLDKDSGPKAGWFLSVLDRKLLLDRLAEITK